jgi:hypothetical protein
MNIEDDYPDVLQNIESAVMSVYREHGVMTDYDVDKALVDLVQTYRNETVGKAPVKPGGDLSILVYEQVASMCNWRLGRTPLFNENGKPGPLAEPLSSETIVLCLKKVRKSLEMWTKEAGRQGYLNYISQFL